MDIDANVRLGQIFMPYAMRQREKAGFTQPGASATRFVHYTSADAGIKIIRSKRIWMRNTTCMADYLEVQHGFDLMNSYFLNPDNKNLYFSALDAAYSGISNEVLNWFNQWWTQYRFFTFVTSISEHDDKEDEHGRLSMWRAFGGSSARVALVFRIPYSTEGSINLKLEFSPVAYLTRDQTHDVIREVIKKIQENTEFLRSLDRNLVRNFAFYSLMFGTICAKHEGFSEEREWRAIYIPTINSSPLMESSVETIGGVPQTIFKIPVDASFNTSVADLDLSKILNRIIIGPTQYPLAMQQAFQVELTRAGCSHVPVMMSRIPLRT